MSPALRAVDGVLTRQVFITGRLTDAITGRLPASPPSLALVYAATPERSFPLQLRLTPDGQFAYFGHPVTDLPELLGAQTLVLRLIASAERYEPQSLNLTLTTANLQLATVTREINGRPVDVAVRVNLPLVRNLVLTPRPVHLAGRVVQRSDPSAPISGAQVRVTAPQPRGPVNSSLQGFYTLQDLPVAAEVTVEVSAPGFDPLTETCRLDFTVPINRRSFALET